MHLRHVYAEGYKALDPIDLELPQKLLFLIGSNGAGKSSTLQALAFAQFFAAGNPGDFFIERGWNTVDVRSRTVEKDHNTLRYHLLFEKEGGTRILWQFAWGLVSRQLLTEQMWISDQSGDPKRLYQFQRKTGLKGDLGEQVAGLIPRGTILTLMDASKVTAHASLAMEVVDWCRRITSLELLSPVAMRSNARGTPKGIGARGQRLSGFLASLDTKTKARIVDRLADFYPLKALSTTRKKAGWVDLRVAEDFEIGAISAQHVSDGFLRLLALCAIPEFGSRSSLVLLDEIEDGIEPHILPRLIERIVKDSSSQFVMTSHSPLLVNFFDAADIALVTRSQRGKSQFIMLPKLGSVRTGLEYFGPGEIWANSGLAALNKDANKAVKERDKDLPDNPVNAFAYEWVREALTRK